MQNLHYCHLTAFVRARMDVLLRNLHITMWPGNALSPTAQFRQFDPFYYAHRGASGCTFCTLTCFVICLEVGNGCIALCTCISKNMMCIPKSAGEAEVMIDEAVIPALISAGCGPQPLDPAATPSESITNRACWLHGKPFSAKPLA